MPQANERQVGGDHYRAVYEHWDLVLDTRMGYFEGNATKYVARWRKKNGREDLEKAKHYIQKLLESTKGRSIQGISKLGAALSRFYDHHDVSPLERVVLEKLIFWTVPQDLIEAQSAIDRLLAPTERRVPRYDIPEAKPVPLTEENHYAERAAAVTEEGGAGGGGSGRGDDELVVPVRGEDADEKD